MRIHANTLTHRDLLEAAQIARVDYEVTEHGSRSRDHAFDVHLTGESRRRPNRRSNDDDYAATWDQWGVFLSVLFDRDPWMTCQPYADGNVFHHRTNDRFDPAYNESGYWPSDAHGDHRFQFEGVPFEQTCTKCSARQIWGPR